MVEIYLTGAFSISGLLFFNGNRILRYLLIVVFLVLQIGFTVYEYLHINATELTYFTSDSLGLLLLTTLTIISIPAFYHSYVYLGTKQDNPRHTAIYFAAVVALLTSTSAAYLSNHIAVTWIFVELTTLSASALIYHRRNNRSLEGTWKYVFVCAISITLVFIGILFLSFSLSGAGADDLSFKNLLVKAPQLNVFWLRLAFIFIFTGFTAKLGLVPMYTAGIDAKDKAPSPAGALLSSVLMNVGFVGIFRSYVVTANSPIHQWTNHVIIIAALLSIFVATVYMTKVKNIKRMFEYSSIEHSGIIMLGLTGGGVGYYAAILHAILHAFIKSSLFFQQGQIYRIYQSKSIYDVGNYFKYNTTGSMVILLGFFFATAMPPSGLFISEFMIFRSLFESNYLWILIVVMLLLTIIIWAFGKNIFKLLFTPAVDFKEDGLERIKPAESISQFILLGLVVYLGLNPPQEFVTLIQEAIKSLPH
ncbi:MAG TPA: proton-conducting transporter membrane subunit [Chitinophagaceae bacterium]|jgi:hydrogenase-4 component F|nr:proton-conducting transporter membrane subunit [Chitinophagaceae bacterium]